MESVALLHVLRRRTTPAGVRAHARPRLDLGRRRRPGLHQSAVSQQLAALEREAGIALLDRSQRPLRATRAGATLRPQVERVWQPSPAPRPSSRRPQGATLRLRLAASRARSHRSSAAVRDLRRTHAELTVRVCSSRPEEAVERLRGGDVDLAVVHHLRGAMPATAACCAGACSSTTSTWSCPMATGSRDAKPSASTTSGGEPLILPRRDTPAGVRSLIEQLCAQAGFAPTGRLRLDDLPAAQAFVAAGIALVPMHGLTLTTSRPAPRHVP